MPKYRFTLEVDASALTTREQRSIHNDLEQYLRTVVLPKGSTVAVARSATVTCAMDELQYEIHKHDGSDECGYCQALANDGRS